jgi:hypothetical protein
MPGERSLKAIARVDPAIHVFIAASKAWMPAQDRA